MADSPLSQGALNDSEEDVLRKHLNPALTGPGWDALIAALATGDAYVAETAALAFDQLFISTASGIYLDRKVGDYGITRPDSIGLSDDAFRKLAIKTTAAKLTQISILEVLLAYYGPDAVQAHVQSGLYQPFNLTDGNVLSIQIDNSTLVNVVFKQGSFDNITAATALEVAGAITLAFRLQGLLAYAIPFTDPSDGNTYVKLYTQTLGLAGVVQVLGGTAQPYLQFPSMISIYE